MQAEDTCLAMSDDDDDSGAVLEIRSNAPLSRYFEKRHPHAVTLQKCRKQFAREVYNGACTVSRKLHNTRLTIQKKMGNIVKPPGFTRISRLQ